MADGSVEIRITGSVDPSVAASANQAKAAMAGLGDTTTVSAKAMAAALAAAGGNLKAITPEMVGLGTAAKATAAGQAGLTAATEASTVATAINAGTINSSRAAYESLALVHEALSGRFTRMVGTSSILAQALAGQAATTKAVSFVTSGLGASILGTIAAIGAATLAGSQYESSQRQMQALVLGVAAASGLSASQLNEAASAAANWASQSESQTRKAAEAFAGAGIQSQETITQLSAAVGTYAQLTGVKFAEAQKTLAEAMKDPIKGAQELHQQLGILDGDQMQQIQRLSDLGEKDQAVAIITQALTQRTNEANQAGIGAAGTWGTMTNALSNLWNWLGKVDTELEDRMIPLLGYVRERAEKAADAIQGTIALQTKLSKQSTAGFDIFKTTPEGESASRLDELRGKFGQLQQALIADTALHGANSDAVKRDREALEDYSHAINTYMTPVQKKLAADALDVKIAQARHEKNAQLVKDLTEQKAAIEQAGQIESNADAKALAAGSGDVAGGKVFAPKGPKGPSIVSQWEEQLHEAEIASGDFFKDQTQAELDFWQSKLAQTKKGSKDWLDVQTKIYDAAKAIAHKQYDEKLADLNDQLEADRDNFKKFQADWADKLAFIKSKEGEESAAYKDAHRQMESETRQHQAQMIRDELSGNNKEVQELRSHLQALQQIRQEYAKAAEAVITEQSQGSILAEVSAATRIGQLHAQLAQQEIADAERIYAEEKKLLDKGVADALKAYGAEDDRYKKAKQDELTAEQKFQDQLKLLQARAAAQQIADIERVKAAYHSYIDGLVSSTTSAFTGLIAGTETWQQAISGIFNSLLSTIDSVLSRIVSNWIVNLIVGKTQQSAINAASVASYAAVAGAAGIASMAAAPFPIDLGAPAFGAAMSAAALAFAPEAALAAGTNLLPRDMVVQAHEGERVIPKADNRKLIELVQIGAGASGGAANPMARAAANDGEGDVHLHFHGPIIGSRAAMEQWARQNRAMFGAGAKAYARMGGNLNSNRR